MVGASCNFIWNFYFKNKKTNKQTKLSRAMVENYAFDFNNNKKNYTK